MTVIQFLQMTYFVHKSDIRINDPNSSDYNITFTIDWYSNPMDNPIISKYANCVIARIYIYADEISILLRGN